MITVIFFSIYSAARVPLLLIRDCALFSFVLPQTQAVYIQDIVLSNVISNLSPCSTVQSSMQHDPQSHGQNSDCDCDQDEPSQGEVVQPPLHGRGVVDPGKGLGGDGDAQEGAQGLPTLEEKLTSLRLVSSYGVTYTKCVLREQVICRLRLKSLPRSSFSFTYGTLAFAV